MSTVDKAHLKGETIAFGLWCSAKSPHFEVISKDTKTMPFLGFGTLAGPTWAKPFEMIFKLPPVFRQHSLIIGPGNC